MCPPYEPTESKPAVLAMADGSVFFGTAVGATNKQVVGELVFNTAMSGYQEVLSDPSYNSQLLTFTYPHIGNVGINPEDWESEKFQVSAIILREHYPLIAGHRGTSDLSSALQEQGIPAIANVDTRRITQLLRDNGSIGACLDTHTKSDAPKAIAYAKDFAGLNDMDLASVVTGTYNKNPVWREGGWCPKNGFQQSQNLPYEVVVYDFGVKRSLLRKLVDCGCNLRIVDAKTPASEVLAMKPHGVVLSNGPGDPAACDYAIKNIAVFLEHAMPILGICLGYQMLAHACGARTVKMKFGHHGTNHPVQSLSDGKIWITSQNHGFMVDEHSLPDCLSITHRSLFDGSLQGLRHRSLAAFGFQGHPEAGPGPNDACSLFSDFVDVIKNNNRAHATTN